MRTLEQSVGQVVLGKGLTREGLPASGVVPAPPPMRVVTKGWWTLRTECKTVDELDRADNAGR